MASQNVNFLLLMSYTDANIIEEGQQMSALQLSQGLARLNAIMEDLGTTNITIPYQTDYEFNLTSGKPSYVFSQQLGADITSPPIVTLNYVQILIGSVWHPINIVPEGSFNLSDRIQGNQALSIPDLVYLTKSTNTSSINFYLGPSQNFPCRVKCLIQNNQLTGNTDLTTLPEIYYKYLWYDLACELSLAIRQIPMPELYVAEKDRLYRKIQSNSDINTISEPNVFFQRNGGVPKPIQTAGFA